MSFTRTKRLTQELMHSRSSFASENAEQLPWKLLANAIILKALEDFEHGVISEREIMRFIKSDYFSILSRGCVSPERIIKEVIIPCHAQRIAGTK